jgi:hypothetical protein
MRRYKVEVREKEDATLTVLVEDMDVGHLVREVAPETTHHAQVGELITVAKPHLLKHTNVGEEGEGTAVPFALVGVRCPLSGEDTSPDLWCLGLYSARSPCPEETKNVTYVQPVQLPTEGAVYGWPTFLL